MYLNNIFDNNYAPTIGVGFGTKSIKIKDNKIKLQVWDTSGQEKFQKITCAYYKGSHGIMLMYNCANPHTFENLDRWHSEILQYASNKVKVFLIGNKFNDENKVVEYT
jgi:small GTP-binding protein